jgi:predicted RNA-binding protein
MSESWERRDAQWERLLEMVKEAPIQPLIDKLSFIKNKKLWGYVFRYGLVEIPKEDFGVVAKEIKRK